MARLINLRFNYAQKRSNLKQEKLDQIDAASKVIVIKQSINSKIIQEELINATVDPTIKICIKKSNHAKEFYIEAIQNTNIYCRDLVNYEDDKLTNFDVA